MTSTRALIFCRGCPIPLILLLASTAPAHGLVCLEWRTTSSSYCVGDIIDAGLYAVSDLPTSDYFGSADIGFGWNNAALQFIGIDNTGGPPASQSRIPCPDTACVANERCPAMPADGDGRYELRPLPGGSFEATVAGTLLATFRFRVIAEAPAAEFRFLLRAGSCITKVYDDVIPTVNVLCPDTFNHSLVMNIPPCHCSPPRVVVQPASAELCEGTPIELSVLAAGTPPLHFQWQKNSIDIPGALDPTLDLPAPTPGQAGIYRVRITNPCGTIFSVNSRVLIWPVGTGDVNGGNPSRVDGGDIQAFIDVLLQAPNGPTDHDFCAADMNADGRITAADVPLFVARLLR